MRIHPWPLFCFILTILAGTASCSHGDRDPYFQYCVTTCNATQQQKQPLPWYLKLLQWDHQSNCKYHCMRNITEQRSRLRLPIFQYYGKWPFVRWYGIEDPAAFLFSLFNLIGNICGWQYYRTRVQNHTKFYKLTLTQFLINVNGWFFACVFHARDTYWTEKLDYFSASLIIAVSIFTCVARIIGRVSDARTRCFGAAVVLVFGYHIGYMSLVKFDYGYNMRFMVVIGAVNVVLWLCWCGIYRKERPHTWKCVVSMGGTGMLALLELVDFPPLWHMVDGHALWHLGTAPLSYLWYYFLLDDERFISQGSHQKFV